jgi:quinol monooxygenase YgiN
MYGMLGKMISVAGKRDALVEILLGSVGEMPGCLSYVVHKDVKDADAIWISEAWDNAASHKASLSLPQVRAAIERAKPLIASFGEYVITEPAGGHGLAKK